MKSQEFPWVPLKPRWIAIGIVRSKILWRRCVNDLKRNVQPRPSTRHDGDGWADVSSGCDPPLLVAPIWWKRAISPDQNPKAGRVLECFIPLPAVFCKGGLGGCINVLGLRVLTHMWDVTLAVLLLHLHTCRMLRQPIFFALAHMLDVTLADLLLHLHTSRMLR